MLRFTPLIVKTLWRHRSRTILTVSGAAVALFVFCFLGSIQEGINALRERQESKGSLIVFQANKFCPATSHLPQDYSRQIAGINGVRDSVPIQVFTNNCRASLDVVVFYGLPPKQLRDVRNMQLLSGDWSAFQRHQDSAVVGRSIAQRRGIRVGDTFSIGQLSVNVAGVFSSTDPAEENYVYCHLDFLQRSNGVDLVGTVTQFEVLLDPGVNALEVCNSIDDRFRNGSVETHTRPKGVFQAQSLGDLVQLIGMARFVGFSCVGLVLALVATTTVMSVQDRVTEHAVLQTIGFSGPRIFSFVLMESILLSLAGGILGVGLALLTLHFSSLSLGAEAVAITFTPSLSLAIVGLMVSVLVGVVAGLVPAAHAASIEIVPALRQQ
jgi:putative ABC transport system permease protein